MRRQLTSFTMVAGLAMATLTGCGNNSTLATTNATTNNATGAPSANGVAPSQSNNTATANAANTTDSTGSTGSSGSNGSNGSNNSSGSNGSNGTSTSQNVRFNGDMASVIAGVQGAPAKMLDTIHATIQGQQYGAGINAVTFTSKSVGYLAGQGIILQTSDGGKLFKTSFRGNVDLSGIASASNNSNTVVAWGKNDVLVSQDAGQTWTTETLKVGSGAVQEVDFVTRDEGFAVVGDGYHTGQLWRTTDGGSDWTQLSIPAAALSVSFGDANDGWIGMVNGNIYKTADAGDNWTVAFKPDVKYPGRPEVHAVSKSACWAMIVGGSGMSQTSYSVFRTTDGSHWSPVLGVSTAGAGPAPDNATKAPKGPGSSPGPMVALSPDQAVVTGVCRACAMGTGQVTSTRDGGQTWTQSPTIPDGMAPPISMSFITLSEGWVLDTSAREGSFLLHTMDGGRTWSEVYPMVHPHPVGGISFVNGNIGYGYGVPGDANVVLKSLDGGHTWNKVGSLPVTEPTNGRIMGNGKQIDFVSENQGYVVASNGTLYGTRDGGQTWSKLSLPEGNGKLESIQFVQNGQVGIANDGTQLADVTVDGGKTWHVAQMPSDPAAYVKVDVYLAGLAKLPVAPTLKTMVNAETAGWDGVENRQIAWTSAQNGYGFFITTDGGGHWRDVDFGTYFESPSSLDFVNAHDGWMLTLSGGLLRTTDGGKTWVHAVH